MKWRDFYIIAAALLIAAVFLCLFPGSGGKTVTVKQNNETVYKGSLYTDKEVKLDGNTLIIKDGVCFMKSAECKNKVCVHTGKISKKGESIICLPNRIIAQIE